ncbi:MAG: zinc ABC transporter ATP-binding protein ZnuC [Rhodospirillaceae bacterium]|nr:zinc ABC transporter ATP-binding protein ZnuC [Rhodospirillaceae bacterium]|tara:strand:- start:1074 stop:1808 length:735 start_codon:yes stop_codon:yes gene_type:complete
MVELIRATNISVARQGIQILENVSVVIGDHNFLTIIGPNGAGKSMLLKCLMGFYLPDSGTIQKSLDLRIGYVPQNFAPEHTMPISVRRFLSLRRNIEKSALTAVAEETDISKLMDQPLFSLSGGERQRVLLARSLLNNPNLLVLDEPAQNLDVSGQLGFYRLVEQVFNERKVSILMVSHDLHLVMASTNEVICLFHHVCCSGEPQIVTKDPEFISLFGNDMATMMAAYQHSHDHVHHHHQNHES